MTFVLPFANSSRKIAVLGGGIAGLSAAFRLARMGHSVRLFEQSNRLGGAIRTEAEDGWLIEAGPNSMQESSPLIPVVIKGLGLTRERLDAAPTARRRYLVRRNRLVAMPSSPSALLLSGLFSPLGKLGLLRDLTRRPRPESADRSIAQLVREHCGREASDYVAQSMAAGIYAGDAEKLSARYAFPRIWDMDASHGSFLRAQQAHARACERRYENVVPTTFSFRRGLQTLVHGYVLQLPADVLTLNARVEALIPGPKWHVVWRDLRGQPADRDWARGDDTGRQVEGFDAVVCALPAAALAGLEFGQRELRPLAALGDIEHAPVSSLFLGYRREQIGHPLDGFGFLAPKRERRKLLGVAFSSSIFPGRAPEGHVALTVLVGGADQAELAARPAAELAEAVKPELEALLQVRGEPVFLRHTYWPRAIPQYNLGYQRFLEAMASCEKGHAGLFLGGHVRDGVSVSNCILSGERLAERVHAHCAG
ncbi:MAG TPA: protoporphyrinogen oxidase [Opitutaceae bacterium]|nr:protoporphyrinogen oxidase [Opitutaceae bacterium]